MVLVVDIIHRGIETLQICDHLFYFIEVMSMFNTVHRTYQALHLNQTLLDLIEGGAAWPQQLLHATSAFLPKDINDAANPLSYRVLLIMPTLYRRWAALRLSDLEEWISTWIHPSMMAGVKEEAQTTPGG